MFVMLHRQATTIDQNEWKRNWFDKTLHTLRSYRLGNITATAKVWRNINCRFLGCPISSLTLNRKFIIENADQFRMVCNLKNHLFDVIRLYTDDIKTHKTRNRRQYPSRYVESFIVKQHITHYPTLYMHACDRSMLTYLIKTKCNNIYAW